MIKVQIRELINSLESLKSIVNQPVKAKVAYHLARLAREVEKETTLFEERRNKLVQKYAQKDENGELVVNENQQWTVATENVDEFMKELNELLDSNVELNVEKILLDDLNCELNATQMVELMPFIEE